MIAALLLAAVAPAGAAPAPAPVEITDDIVVIAKRLSKIRFVYHAEHGQLMRCDIRQSSGSPGIDSVTCEAARQCALEQPDKGDRGLVPCIRGRVRSLAMALRKR